MKNISQHLGEIIVALAAVALLIMCVTVFRTDIGAFFDSIIGKEQAVGENVLGKLDGVGSLLGDRGSVEIEVPGLGTITVVNPNGAEFTYDSETGVLIGTTPLVPGTPAELEDNTPMIEFTAGTFEANTSYTEGEYVLETYEVTKTRTRQPVAYKYGMYLTLHYVGEGEYEAYEITADHVEQASTYIAYCPALNSKTTVNGFVPYTLSYRTIANTEDDTLENAIYLAAYTQKGTGFSWKVAKWNGTEYADVDCRTEIDAITDFTETYTETVKKTVVISEPSSSTEYVYVPGGSMKAEANMTWAEWLVSEYNTFGADTTKVWDANYNEVALDSEIEAGERYGFKVEEGTNDSPWPIEWNTMDVMGNPSVTFDGVPYVKVSDFTPSPDEFTGTSVTISAESGESLVVCFSKVTEYVDGFYCYALFEGTDAPLLAVASVYSTAVEDYDFFFPEKGLYVMDFGSITGEDLNMVLDLNDSGE